MDNIVETYKEATQQLHKVISQTPQRVKQLHDLVQRSDWEEQDLLHLAELGNFNAAEGYYITKQISNVRKKRRKYKDELEALSELRKVINNNSKLQVHMDTLSKSLKSDVEKKSKRKYNIRVRKDLAQRFERIHEREGK